MEICILVEEAVGRWLVVKSGFLFPREGRIFLLGMLVLLGEKEQKGFLFTYIVFLDFKRHGKRSWDTHCPVWEAQRTRLT